MRQCWPTSRRCLVLWLALVIALLPSALAARAQEAEQPTAVGRRVTVAGVVGATLRAEADGASAALAIVARGEALTIAGPGRVTSGVAWWQVRTDGGQVGYIPAGLLAPLDGAALPAVPLDPVGQPSPALGASIAAAERSAVGDGAAVVPGGFAGASAVDAGATSGGAEVVPSARHQPPGASPTTGPADPPAGPTAQPAAIEGRLRPPRTTVEQRRGRTVTVTQIDEERAPNGRPMGAGRIVVGFKPGANQEARVQAHRAAGAGAAVRAGLPEVAVVEVQPGTVPRALAAYRARADVAWAEPDYIRRVAVQPNDPLLPSQSGLAKIGAPFAWDVTTGSPNIKVAILDCGVFSESSTYKPPDGGAGHEDLRGKIVAERNFTDAVTGADDWCNHGTLMAGIAGARTNTDTPTGVAGLGFDTMLLNGKVLNDTGSGLDSWVASGIVWAADSGADVISLSLGSANPCSQTLQSAVDYAWQRGAVLVAAAGNGGPDQIGDPASDAPASCANVISVGAISPDDGKATFSNFGPPTAPRVQLAAPGVNILSTNYVGTYSTVSGTSPATPHVAGVAALVKARHGGTNQEIVERLLSTADPIAGTGSLWANGRVSAAAAVGPASCSPRPRVTVSPLANGSALDVLIGVEGLGNALRYVRVGGATGPVTNAALSFPGTQSALQGTEYYVPMSVGTSLTFQVTRSRGGAATTVPFTVFDGCGAWNSFVGGGPSAGF